MHTWTTRVPSPRRRHRPAGRVAPAYLALGLLYAGSMLALSVTAAVSDSTETAAEVARFAFGVFGLVAAIRAARQPSLPPRLRQAWGAVAACFAVLVISTPPLVVLGGTGATTPGSATAGSTIPGSTTAGFTIPGSTTAGFTIAADVTHVVFVVALIIALQRFPLAPTSRRARWKTALDALTVLVGGSMVLWYTAFAPYVTAHGLHADMVVSAVVNPIGDLILLFSVSRALLRGADQTAQRPLRLLTAGTFILFAGDAVHGYLVGHDIAQGSTWQFFCWITTDALLAAAAVEQCRSPAQAATEPRVKFRIGQFLPFAAVAMGPVLMIQAAMESGAFMPWGGLALGGAALSALVLFRQTLVQRESDEAARTDGLTGLANRSRFRQTSYRALARGARTGQHSAVMVIDMNGFKQVNDTLGHKSGDLVLVEFAEVLRRCVPAPHLPARLGGDEFAVVLTDLGHPEQAYDIAGQVAAALGPVVVDGRLIALAASIGVAASGPGELTHDELVHRADLAMYRAKALGPDTRWAVWREPLETEIVVERPAAEDRVVRLAAAA